MRSLCYYGNPVLRKMCKEVTEITPHVLRVIQELKEVVRQHNGSGLAAPQIGYDLRIFVNDLSEKTDEDGYPLILEETEVYINPKITKFSKRKFIRDEGCLSIPGMSAEVVRSQDIEIEYMNEKGETVVTKEKKWRAKCLQHELDHINGILYIDHISKEDMERIRPSLVALEAKTKKNLNTTISPSDFQV